MSEVRILVVRNDVTAPVARFGEWLVAAGARLREIDAVGGEPVPRTVPEDVDAVVPLGGEPSADSDETAPWLPDERAMLVDALERGVPVFGICLGSQLMAHAFGGEVVRAQPGEVGITDLARTPAAQDDPVFGSLPDLAPVAQYHQDEVRRLPEGAVLLASTPGCVNQAWRIGDAAWAVQGHPEIDAEIIRGWVEDDPAHARRCGSTGDQVVADVASVDRAVQSAWRPVAEAFVEVVRRRARSGDVSARRSAT